MFIFYRLWLWHKTKNEEFKKEAEGQDSEKMNHLIQESRLAG